MSMLQTDSRHKISGRLASDAEELLSLHDLSRKYAGNFDKTCRIKHHFRNV